MSNENEKRYKLSDDQLKPLAEGIGFCFATDAITVEGHKISFMYREEPDNDVDSGWRFLTGAESQEYLDEESNIGVFDVNTIANYDPDIIPYLESPVGTAFEREDGQGEFVEIELVDDDEDFDDEFEDDDEDEDDYEDDDDVDDDDLEDDEAEVEKK
ncbi:DUF2185 domain-containing protein [Planctomicrobium sp. SH527]|uniref:DUF2185 domain-containing protein n=1 Tax=Planctomicrobium sp. SH527 TaxID=3448123 RepID=UPI003F5B45D8